MSEPMTDARLAHLTAVFVDQDPRDWFAKDGLADVIRELLAEVTRVRAMLAEHPDEWGVALTHGDTSTTSAGGHEDVARRSVAVDPGRRRLMHRRKASQWREIGGEGD